MDFNLETLDFIIVVSYLLFVIILGFYFGTQHKNAEDYFLAGRNLTWPLIGFSLFASNISSNTLIGLTGSGYEDGGGFYVFSYEWMAIAVLIIFAIFFLPFYLRNKIFTIPEYLERRFDYRTRAYASGIAIILNIFVDISATLYAGGVVIQMIFPGLALWQIITLLAIIAGIYTISGGLSSVVYTDAVQAVILIFGSCIITYFAWSQSGGFDEVMKITDPEHFDIIRSAGHDSLPWPGLITGVFLLGFYFWGTNQYITQRTLASKSTLHGQWGAMFAGFLKLSILFIMIMPGAFARVLYPDIETIDRVYPTMMFDLLPTGILGLVLAGLIAAMMSSIDSGLNSVSTLVTMDFYQRLVKNRSQAQLMGIGRIITSVVMIIAVLWSPQIIHFEGLWNYLQYVLSWFCPPIIALFALGLFWKRANTSGAYWCIAVGAITTLLVIIFNRNEELIDFLYMTGIQFSLSAFAMIVGSFTAPKPSDEVTEATVWSPGGYAEETKELRQRPAWQNYRYQAIALVILVVVIILVY